MKIWLTSDYHLNHVNISGPTTSRWKSGFRAFDDVYQMNDTIIDGVNKYVEKDDVLYFLGDFSFGDHTEIPELRNRIICKNIHFIKGNHDRHIDLYKGHFKSMNDVLRFDYKNINFFLSHYSHRVWPGHHRGNIHLYAHSHGNIPDHGKSMDVGIDVAYKLFGEYRPFNIDEIMDMIDKKNVAIVDHHV